jgi:chaperonin GroES
VDRPASNDGERERDERTPANAVEGSHTRLVGGRRDGLEMVGPERVRVVGGSDPRVSRLTLSLRWIACRLLNIGTGTDRTGKEHTVMKVRPLQDRVLIKRLEDDTEKTKGGLYIPDSAKEKPQQGKVMAVGKGRVSDDGKVIPLDVKAGDKILFGKYSGSEIKVDGEELLIMREEDILGVVEG